MSKVWSSLFSQGPHDSNQLESNKPRNDPKQGILLYVSWTIYILHVTVSPLPQKYLPSEHVSEKLRHWKTKRSLQWTEWTILSNILGGSFLPQHQPLLFLVNLILRSPSIYTGPDVRWYLLHLKNIHPRLDTL